MGLGEFAGQRTSLLATKQHALSLGGRQRGAIDCQKGPAAAIGRALNGAGE